MWNLLPCSLSSPDSSTSTDTAAPLPLCTNVTAPDGPSLPAPGANVATTRRSAFDSVAHAMRGAPASAACSTMDRPSTWFGPLNGRFRSENIDLPPAPPIDTDPCFPDKSPT